MSNDVDPLLTNGKERLHTMDYGDGSEKGTMDGAADCVRAIGDLVWIRSRTLHGKVPRVF